MSGTLLSICTDALEGVQDVAVPSTIAGNTSPTAKLLKSAALDIGRFLEREKSWQELKKSYTFATSNGVTAYDIPEEMRRFANMTLWSETDEWPLIKVSDVDWRALQSGGSSLSLPFRFTVFQNQINIHPAPGADSYTIAFDYYTKYFCESSGGTGQARWLADTDVSRLDDNLMALGVRYKYLERNGQPYEEEKASFIEALDSLFTDNRPREMIALGRGPLTRPAINIPDSNWQT